MSAQGRCQRNSPLRQVLARRKRLARKAVEAFNESVCWRDGVLIFSKDGRPIPNVPKILTADQQRSPAELAEAAQLGVSIPQLRQQKALAAQREKQEKQAAEREQGWRRRDRACATMPRFSIFHRP